MLNFRNSTIVLVLISGIFFLLKLWMEVPLWILLFPVLIYLSLLINGSANIKSSFFIKVKCKAETVQKEIALTFDDGPSEKLTPLILDILKRQKVEAAFFCIGKKTAGNISVLQRIDREGHIIGNHSYSHHFFFDLYSSSRMLNELKKTNFETESVINKKMKLFRPPYGVTNPNLAKAIRKGGFLPVGWSIRSMDTVTKDEDVLFEKIITKLNAGDVLLFHDTSEATAKGLENFILKSKNLGFKFVRLDQLLKIKAYA